VQGQQQTQQQDQQQQSTGAGMLHRPSTEQQPSQQQPAGQSAAGMRAAGAGASQYAGTGYDDMSGYGGQQSGYGQQYGGAFAQVTASMPLYLPSRLVDVITYYAPWSEQSISSSCRYVTCVQWFVFRGSTMPLGLAALGRAPGLTSAPRALTRATAFSRQASALATTNRRCAWSPHQALHACLAGAFDDMILCI
jgi:hypothetical protein